MRPLAEYVYSDPAWSPYLVGTLIGILALTTLVLAKEKVSASSAYASLAGLLVRLVAPRHAASLKYFREHPPALDWTAIFVVFTAIGAFLAALGGGELTGRYLPPLWVARFGEDSQLLRTLFALAGGVLMAFGARMAGGCTSGHGISGTLQLAVSSWISVVCFFIGGVLAAALLYQL